MQNSFVKLLSIVGVVGIGTLSVLEVQNRLPIRPGETIQPVSPAGTERQFQAQLEQSDFDRAGFLPDSDSVVYDNESLDGLVDLSEPSDGDIDTSVDPSALTDQDPFAENTGVRIPPPSNSRASTSSQTALAINPTGFSHGTSSSDDEGNPPEEHDTFPEDNSVWDLDDEFPSGSGRPAPAISNSNPTEASPQTELEPFDEPAVSKGLFGEDSDESETGDVNDRQDHPGKSGNRRAEPPLMFFPRGSGERTSEPSKKTDELPPVDRLRPVGVQENDEPDLKPMPAMAIDDESLENDDLAVESDDMFDFDEEPAPEGDSPHESGEQDVPLPESTGRPGQLPDFDDSPAPSGSQPGGQQPDDDGALPPFDEDGEPEGSQPDRFPVIPREPETSDFGDDSTFEESSSDLSDETSPDDEPGLRSNLDFPDDQPDFDDEPSHKRGRRVQPPSRIVDDERDGSSDDRGRRPELRPIPRGDFDDEESARASSRVMRPHLTVRKDAPEKASVGRPLIYSVIVTNEGGTPAHDVIVEDDISPEVELNNTSPRAKYDERSRKLIWKFDELPAGETRKMQVEIVPTGRGVINGVATVRFKTEVSTTTIIEAPQLALKLEGPSDLRVGEEAEYRYVIRNNGDGAAEAVVLRSILPAGLRHPVGSDLEYEIDSIMPGDEREVVLAVVAEESGEHETTAEVSADGGAHATTQSTVHIVGQQLSILRRGPARRYVDRPAVYENIITNETAFEATDVKIVERIPPGMEFVSASSNADYNPRDRLVTWAIDRIDPSDSETLTVKLIPKVAGDQKSTVTVVENAGFRSGAEHTTAVQDLHNMSARISQLDGAVATGEVFDIDITLENRGTAAATDLQLLVHVPRGIVPKQAGSPDIKAIPEPGLDGTVIRYQPIQRIEPGDERTFRIRFVAEEAVTNGVIEAHLRYKEMRRELVTSESVTSYDDRL